MWATRLRCPSEAAYPQVSPPPRSDPCRRATRASAIVEGHPETDAGPGLATVGVGFQMHFFVLDRAPQAFDEDVVHETSAPVHRNRDSGSFELAGERGAGELRTLVGVENLRL